jgi:exonuclease SbcC
MFTSIEYDVTFPNGPRPHFSGKHVFKEGFGAIVGPNEAGKSLLLEFLRFSLFGTGALRGPATDYKSLSVKTSFVLKGETWRVERGIDKAKLFRPDGAIEATGVKPVNLNLLRKFGFGLDVFDVANVVNQGDIERLGSMRPAERQRLVDSTVGLDKIETLAKYCNDTARAFEGEAKGIESTLVTPVKPSEPECWPNRKVMEDFLFGAKRDALLLAGIEGELRAPAVVKPVEPTCAVQETKAELEAAVAADETYRKLRTELAQLPQPINIAEARLEIEAYEAYQQAQDVLRYDREPVYSKADLEEMIAAHELGAAWDVYLAGVKRQDQLTAQLANATHVDCPSCDHHFPLDADAFEKLDAELMALDLEQPKQPRPGQQMESISSAKQYLAGWDGDKIAARRAAAEAVPVASAPAVREDELPRYEAAAVTRPGLQAQLDELVLIDNAHGKLATLWAYEAQDAAYLDALQAYENDLDRRADLTAQKDELDYAPARVVELEPIVARFAPYERDLVAYRQVRATYDAQVSRVAAAASQGLQWRDAREALMTLRTSIKQHLYPSLATAASYFISGMTGGQRTRIDISDTFDIDVDGQALDTLSGSGKAVANLAIRLGLGRVLTHSVFPVVLADEIDASMDDDRAEQTADVLHQCARRLSQLLLVSHKRPEAEYYLDLGEQSGQPSIPQ